VAAVRHSRVAGHVVDIAGLRAGGVGVTLTWYFPQLDHVLPGWLEQWIYPIDKPDLDVLRFVHFLAVRRLRCVSCEDWPGLGSPWLRPMILCGQHSLVIFCLGVFLAFAGYFLLDKISAGIGVHFLVAMFGILVMFAVAWMASWYNAPTPGLDRGATPISPAADCGSMPGPASGAGFSSCLRDETDQKQRGVSCRSVRPVSAAPSPAHPSAAAPHGIRAAQTFLRGAAPHDSSRQISKQNGHQILFIEASAALQKGEKVGLVGPNGAGKTTLFRISPARSNPTRARSRSIAASPSAISARMSARCRAAARCPR